MTNKNESRDDCIAAIKECIGDDLERSEIIDKMVNDYPGVHKSTFYTSVSYTHLRAHET